MRHRVLATLAVLVMAMVVVSPPLVAQRDPAPSEAWSPPQTPWGHPDLQGVWDFRTLTPFERPRELEGQAVYTDEEASAFEATRLSALWERDSQEPPDTVGNYNQFWLEPGTGVVDTKRTSLVVDPPDGRIPALTPEAEQRRAANTEQGRGLRRHTPPPGGFVGDLGHGGVQVRCLVGFNSGPPMTPGGYNQNMQLFQTPDAVVILNEMIHDARIVPLDARAHLQEGIRQWLGDSRGRWEDDTLVVETTNFLRETAFQDGLTGSSLRLVERFTRVSSATLMYEVTVEDPTVWTRSWTYQLPMARSEYSLYEYACHEGNYGLYNILAGAEASPEANVLSPEQAAEEAARQGTCTGGASAGGCTRR